MIPHSRPLLEAADREAVLARLDRGMVAEGEETGRLERELADRSLAEGAVAVGSGSQALVLALEAAGAGPGSGVVVPTYVCADVLASIEATGAEPVLTDVDAGYGLEVERAAGAVTRDTAALLVVHPFGRRPDLRSLRALGPPVIEDRAHRLPMSEGSPEPLDDLAVFSFHATKMLAGGEGGAVVAGERGDLEAIRARKRFRDTGYRRNLYPLSDLQAALVRSQLRRSETFLERRRELASRFADAVADLRTVEPVFDAAAEDHHFFRFPLRVDPGVDDALLREFERAGVAARRPVDRLLHHVSGSGERSEFPTAEELYRTTLSLPFHPSLTEGELDRVLGTLQRILD